MAWALGQVAQGGAGAALLDGLRRHEVACVQRRAPGQALPKSHLQADFDVLHPAVGSTAEQLLGEAEVGAGVWGGQRPLACAAAAAASPTFTHPPAGLPSMPPTHLIHATSSMPPTHRAAFHAPCCLQVISAVAGVLEELPECGQVELRLGHRQLLEAALKFAGVPRELRASVVQLLATASGEPARPDRPPARLPACLLACLPHYSSNC